MASTYPPFQCLSVIEPNLEMLQFAKLTPQREFFDGKTLNEIWVNLKCGQSTLHYFFKMRTFSTRRALFFFFFCQTLYPVLLQTQSHEKGKGPVYRALQYKEMKGCRYLGAYTIVKQIWLLSFTKCLYCFGFLLKQQLTALGRNKLHALLHVRIFL